MCRLAPRRLHHGIEGYELGRDQLPVSVLTLRPRLNDAALLEHRRSRSYALDSPSGMLMWVSPTRGVSKLSPAPGRLSLNPSG
jgi:hypothetical protein